MSRTDRDTTAAHQPFSLTFDHYGRLWLHAKLEGIEVAIDLADKETAFKIMAEKMAEAGFDYRRVGEHQSADNDDQRRR